nr:UDP-N-acetylmuramoyl-L-alanine--D-glutamate ligase [Lachnospiraceae bacterium]
VGEELREGVLRRGEEIFMAQGGKSESLMNIREMRLVGLCNVENVMAAILASEAMGVPKEEYLDVIKNFRAVEHRIEFVEEVRGVAYYNDSKGTNPDAAIQAISAMERPTILIGGGYDKESDYDQWVEAFLNKVKLLVLIGQTKKKIAACAESHGFRDIVFADTFEEAFGICVQNAVGGDAVLLSPACASWGMFSNYEERGRLFKELVYRERERM